MFYPAFKNFSGDAGTYITSIWFFLVWSGFFLGGSSYLLYDAIHGVRWFPVLRRANSRPRRQ
jgi:hypothetical protein